MQSHFLKVFILCTCCDTIPQQKTCRISTSTWFYGMLRLIKLQRQQVVYRRNGKVSFSCDVPIALRMLLRGDLFKIRRCRPFLINVVALVAAQLNGTHGELDFRVINNCCDDVLVSCEYFLISHLRCVQTWRWTFLSLTGTTSFVIRHSIA